MSSFSIVTFNSIADMFILANQRDSDPDGSFTRYRKYLCESRERFPPSAYELATSDWYFDASSHHAPHDSWLESISIAEPSLGERHERRAVAINVRLLGPYHDGYIDFHYPIVHEYKISANAIGKGHGDWRYDEFRLDQKGRLIHEIEWASNAATNTWVIVASDVHHRWIPKTKPNV